MSKSGWFREPARHSLAARGVKTRKISPPKTMSILDKYRVYGPETERFWQEQDKLRDLVEKGESEMMVAVDNFRDVEQLQRDVPAEELAVYRVKDGRYVALWRQWEVRKTNDNKLQITNYIDYEVLSTGETALGALFKLSRDIGHYKTSITKKLVERANRGLHTGIRFPW